MIQHWLGFVKPSFCGACHVGVCCCAAPTRTTMTAMDTDALPEWAARWVSNLRKRGATRYVRTGDLAVLVVFPDVHTWSTAVVGVGDRFSLLPHATMVTRAVRDWRGELTDYGIPCYLRRWVSSGVQGRIYLAYPWDDAEKRAYEEATGNTWGDESVRCKSRCEPIPGPTKRQ